jgi:hypothetical protein
MYSGGSLFLIAVGAILYFALTLSVPWVNRRMVGLILMILGSVGLLFSIVSAATHRHSTD